MRKRLMTFAAALVLAASPLRAESVQLDAGNLAQLALLMLDSHQPAQALAMAEALLQRDPGDSKALAIKSRAERDLGQYATAVASGKAAWTAAGTPALRYDAAMVTAQALASGGSKFRAQFWLRRAMEAAPDAATRRAAERDFSYVRSRSRLWLRFDASIQPSDNVNNGSSSNVLWFYGLPLVLSGDAQALSGVEANLGLTLKYRLAETERAKTDLKFAAVQTAIALSDAAKAQAPGASGGDYAYSALELGLERNWRPATGVEAFAAGTFGKSWYAGAEMANYLRLDLGATRALSPKLSLKGTLSAEQQDRQDSAIRSSDSWTLGLGVIGRTAAKDRVELALSFRDTVSTSSEIDHDRVRLQLGWDRAEPLFGAQLSLDLWGEARDYDRSRYSADGRQDRTLGAELALAFDKVDYMGFIPVVTLSGARTASNIDLYDSTSLGVGFSIRSKY